MWTDDPVKKKKVRMNITGQKFGRLTVIECVGVNKHNQSRWKCRCDCGNEVIVTGIHLKNGHTVSCGKHATYIKHGLRNTRLYKVWLTMKSRCNNPNMRCYKHYGGRGISVCGEWENDFLSFHEWAMENGYDENAPFGICTLDRIDVNGNYEPSNCRWVDMKVQRSNQRKDV